MPRPRAQGPNLAQVLEATIEKTYRNLHKAEPARVLSYDSETQTVNVQPVIDFEIAPGEYARSLPLRDVPVCWPSGAAGFLHVPLAAGDHVLIVYCDEDFSRWFRTGSLSPPELLGRHGMNPIAIPGLHRTRVTATAGHVTLAATDELRLGDDGATDPVALKSLVEGALLDLLEGVIDAAGSITAPGGGPAFVAALNTFKNTYELALQTGAQKVKAQ